MKTLNPSQLILNSLTDLGSASHQELARKFSYLLTPQMLDKGLKQLVAVNQINFDGKWKLTK